MSSRGAHRNDTEKAAREGLISTGKTVRISVKTFFFFFLENTNFRPEKPFNSDKTAAFSASVLEFTKSEIRHH